MCLVLPQSNKLKNKQKLQTGPSLPGCLRAIPPLDTAAARLPEVSMAIAPTVSCIKL